MVLSELLQLAGAEAVESGIAHMTEGDLVLVKYRQDDGRAHPGAFGACLRGLMDGGIGDLDRVVHGPGLG